MRQIKHFIAEHKIYTKKSLGQHFLKDESVIDDIISLVKQGISDNKQNVIIEIGPGCGFLTQAIMKIESKNLTLITVEKDERFAEILSVLHAKINPKLKFCPIFQDALLLDLRTLEQLQCLNKESTNIILVGNLPYNIGTTLFLNWMEYGNFFGQMVLMLQKEVCDRIVGTTSSKNYSKPSIIASLTAEAKMELIIRPESFDPPPKVMSGVVSLRNFQGMDYEDIRVLYKFCDVIFAKRRKTISNNLKSFLDLLQIEKLLESVQVPKNYRAEQISPQKILAMAKLFAASADRATTKRHFSRAS